MHLQKVFKYQRWFDYVAYTTRAGLEIWNITPYSWNADYLNVIHCYEMKSHYYIYVCTFC